MFITRTFCSITEHDEFFYTLFWVLHRATMERTMLADKNPAINADNLPVRESRLES